MQQTWARSDFRDIYKFRPQEQASISLWNQELDAIACVATVDDVAASLDRIVAVARPAKPSIDLGETILALSETLFTVSRRLFDLDALTPVVRSDALKILLSFRSSFEGARHFKLPGTSLPAKV